jgi:hypothetical protein
MADSTSVQDAGHQDLTDDQIQQLLLEAENRLRGSEVTQADDLASIRIPKLATGSSLETYIRQGDDVAAVNATKITDPKQKELANSLHAVGKKETKVSSRHSLFYLFPSCYEENYPNAKRLIRRQQSVLGCAVLVRVLLFHSYSEHLLQSLSLLGVRCWTNC